MLYAQTGNLEGAQDLYQTALEASPSFEPARRNLRMIADWREELVRAGAIEIEPNDDLFEPTQIPLNLDITGTLENEEDQDHFMFTTPEVPRDWYSLEIENLSTTLRPRTLVYDADKRHIQSTSAFGSQVTPGQNTETQLPLAASAVHFAELRSLGGAGAYRLTVRPLNRYDGFEPNDDILRASAMGAAGSWEADLMDESDVDYYLVRLDEPGQHLARLENLSTTLRPRILIYDADKRHIGSTSAFGSQVTPGQNITATFPDVAEGEYFVEVRSLGGSGPYRLAIGAQ